MKLGTENRNKVIAAVALGVLAVLLLVFELQGWFGGSASSASTVGVSDPSISSARQRGSGGTRGGNKKDAVQNLDPSLRFDMLRSSEDTKYEGNGRNIFRAFVEPPPRALASVVTTPQVTNPQQTYVPPPPPPIELKFYGFATPAGGTKRVFLAHNEDVFIAKEGDIVDRRYKVVKISPMSVDILDVLSNNRQSIPLTQG